MRTPFILRVTGAAAIAYTFAPTLPCRLLEVRLHLSAAGGADNFTITLDSAGGAVYDTVLHSEDMTLVTDAHYKPNPPVWLTNSGDELEFAWTNASTRTYGLEIIYAH